MPIAALQIMSVAFPSTHVRLCSKIEFPVGRCRGDLEGRRWGQYIWS